jgi:plasmid stability protein
MKTLLIREIPDDVHDSLVLEAENNRRSKEKHAFFLLEAALSRNAADTCGELSDRIWSEPEPNVDVKEIDSYLATRELRQKYCYPGRGPKW